MSSILEKIYDKPKIKENEKQLYKVPRVTYNKFENTLECDPGIRFQIAHAIPTKSN